MRGRQQVAEENEFISFGMKVSLMEARREGQEAGLGGKIRSLGMMC